MAAIERERERDRERERGCTKSTDIAAVSPQTAQLCSHTPKPLTPCVGALRGAG